MSAAAINSAIEALLRDYIAHPYVQYTEHGVHAYFFARLYAALRPQDRYLETLPGGLELGRVCRIQKEYPTPTDLGKSKRQHWDTCLLCKPALESTTANKRRPLFDRLQPEAIVEFGLNEGRPHLEEDVRRLSHADVQADLRYAVHLVRISGGPRLVKMSSRDTTATERRAKAFESLEWIRMHLEMGDRRRSVSVFVARACDGAGGAWKITANAITPVT